MKTRADYLAYAVRLTGHIARLNTRLADVLQTAGTAADEALQYQPCAAPVGKTLGTPISGSALCRADARRSQHQPCAAPVPWFAHGKGLQALAKDLAESAQGSVGLARDGSAGPMAAVHRAAVQLEEMAGVVYAVDAERVRQQILDALPTLSVGKRERELARRIREIVECQPCAAPSRAQHLTYSPEAKCPGCGEVVPQDERVCPKCGLREGDPEQR